MYGLRFSGLGDGLAEPVGIAFGNHKYQTSGLDKPHFHHHNMYTGFRMPIWYTSKAGLTLFSMASEEKFVRSYEGSACVFLSGLATFIPSHKRHLNQEWSSPVVTICTSITRLNFGFVHGDSDNSMTCCRFAFGYKVLWCPLQRSVCKLCMAGISLAQAISPHTMDTPFLMGLGGGSIYLILKLFWSE